MAKSDLIQFDGRVIDVCAGGIYKIQLEKNDMNVSAKLCGKMRRYNIHVVAGDKVAVGFSQHDMGIGLIVHRYR